MCECEFVNKNAATICCGKNRKQWFSCIKMKSLHIFYTSVSAMHDRLLNTRTGKVKSVEKLMGPTFEKCAQCILKDNIILPFFK